MFAQIQEIHNVLIERKERDPIQEQIMDGGEVVDSEDPGRQVGPQDPKSLDGELGRD
jgi:hypothetical protein